jgi:F-type H+-transporting ATPase subunit a
MEATHAITWGSLLLEPLEHLLAEWGVDPDAGVDALFVSALLVLFAFFAGRRYRGTAMLEPQGRPTLGFVAEWSIGVLLKFFDGVIEHGARPYFILLGTFSFFILGNNLIGQVPGFNPPTDQFNVTITLALITFVVAHTIGIRTHGFGYVKKFMGPLWWLVPLMFPLEVISNLVRPVSLSVRLFGNMTGDHQVVAAFTSMLAVGLPVPFMGLGVFVAFVQMFVFVILSAVYFQDALAHPH